MRTVVTLAVALVLAFAAAACGGGEEVAPTPETVEGEVQEQTVGEGDAAAGKTVFTNEANPACGSCHTFQAAGTNGQTGPNLDEALAGDDPQTIFESIVNPNAEITEGFQEGIMPDTYDEQLSEKQLADLVAFLNENKGG
jgi:mono/diheme cytochrome c family protein